MYGSIASVRLRPGTLPAMKDLFKEFEDAKVPGSVGALMYRMDDDPNAYMLVVVFESKESYHANAQDPAQNDRFMTMRALMSSDPEWHDGEIVLNTL